MTSKQTFFNRLYVRIWLAVVLAVAVLILLVGFAWRESAERKTVEFNRGLLVRELVLRNEKGDIIGSAIAEPRAPAMPLEFNIQLNKDVVTGNTITAELPRPKRINPDTGVAEPLRPFGGPMEHNMGEGGMYERDRDARKTRNHPLRRERVSAPPQGSWFTPPFGFVWMLGLVGLAVALGTYPVIRRLTKRLQTLQSGVDQWGQGDLSTRVPVNGNDEVAFLAERFNTAASRVEALVASHKSLLANASHELRSPLTRIRMSIELMDNNAANPAQQKLKDEIARNINELDALIAEILLASRLDAAQADVGVFESVDLIGLAAEECALAGADLDVQGVTQKGLTQLSVQGVPKLLRRAIRNLLENANRYAKPKTEVGDDPGVQLQLSVDHNVATIRVLDSGPGVPAEWRERIFEPFFRAPGASERDGGVGLGLALVKSIAQRHGGSAKCLTGPQNKGACFEVTLPMVPVAGNAPETSR